MRSNGLPGPPRLSTGEAGEPGGIVSRAGPDGRVADLLLLDSTDPAALTGALLAARDLPPSRELAVQVAHLSGHCDPEVQLLARELALRFELALHCPGPRWYPLALACSAGTPSELARHDPDRQRRLRFTRRVCRWIAAGTLGWLVLSGGGAWSVRGFSSQPPSPAPLTTGPTPRPAVAPRPRAATSPVASVATSRPSTAAGSRPASPAVATTSVTTTHPSDPTSLPRSPTTSAPSGGHATAALPATPADLAPIARELAAALFGSDTSDRARRESELGKLLAELAGGPAPRKDRVPDGRQELRQALLAALNEVLTAPGEPEQHRLDWLRLLWHDSFDRPRELPLAGTDDVVGSPTATAVGTTGRRIGADRKPGPPPGSSDDSFTPSSPPSEGSTLPLPVVDSTRATASSTGLAAPGIPPSGADAATAPREIGRIEDGGNAQIGVLSTAPAEGAGQGLIESGSAPISQGSGTGTGLEVRQTSTKPLDGVPGRVITAGFLVMNHTGQAEDLAETLELPPGFRSVTPPFGFTLGASRQEVRLASFSLPLGCPAGTYTVRYVARGKKNPAVQGAGSLLVTVKALTKIELRLVNKPENVLAGETYACSLNLVNGGNASIRVKLVDRGSPPFPTTIEPASLQLKPGESQEIRVKVKTDRRAKARLSHSVTIDAVSLEGKGEVLSTQTSIVEVITTESARVDPYFRLPGTFRHIVLFDKGHMGFQTEILGGGRLSPRGTDALDYRVVYADQANLLYGLREEYRVHYASRPFDLVVGDSVYGLSALTEWCRYGHGLSFDYNPGRLELGGYQAEDRTPEPRQEAVGFYAGYRVNDRFKVRSNLLTKHEPLGFSDTIASLEASVRPTRHTDVNVEYAVCGTDRLATGTGTAWRLLGSGTVFKTAQFTLERTHADPDFFGFYHDSDYGSAALSFPLGPRLSTSLSMRFSETNQGAPAPDLAPGSDSTYRGTMAYDLAAGTQVTLDLERYNRRLDTLEAAQEIQEDYAGLTVSQSFKRANVQLSTEQGTLEDRILGRTQDIQRYGFYGTYTPNRRLSYSVRTSTGPEKYASPLRRTTMTGAAVVWRAESNLTIDLSFDNTIYKMPDVLGPISSQVHQYLSSLTYLLNGGQTFALRARYLSRSGKDPPEHYAMATFSMPFGIALARRRDIGRLKGRIHDEERPGKPGIPKVIVRLGAATTVTDQIGQFEFAALTAGKFALRVDKDSIGLARMTRQQLPIDVVVQGGKTVSVSLGVLTAGRLAGRLAVCARQGQGQISRFNMLVEGAEKDQAKPAEMEEVGGAPDMIVELTNGKEIQRRVTDQKGRFVFEELIPGSWKLSVREENLPELHTIERPEANVEVSAGKTAEVVIRILPKVRTIKLIDQGEKILSVSF
ncbi:MAG: hypothetical protein HY815_27180 [Candidatus Riflebacteria bacterium]|nr:hypothetical protein [Candidatus Riflebacteria bacterium]